MMRDVLRDLLTPADDGRGFGDAVLLNASGALARRRAAAEAALAAAPVWGWLERWARPWLVAALIGSAVLVMVPLRTPEPSQSPVSVASAGTDMAAALLPADVAAAVTNGR